MCHNIPRDIHCGMSYKPFIHIPDSCGWVHLKETYMDLSFITEQLDNFSTFGNAIHGLFTGFAKFAENMNTMINGSDDLTEATSKVFDGLSSKSESEAAA